MGLGFESHNSLIECDFFVRSDFFIMKKSLRTKKSQVENRLNISNAHENPL